MGWGPSYLNKWSRGSVFYTALPLYHSSAGGLILGQMMWKGRTVVIRRQFSVKNFWNDVKKYNVTVINYIGETARFLLGNFRIRNHKWLFAAKNIFTANTWDQMGHLIIKFWNVVYAITVKLFRRSIQSEWAKSQCSVCSGKWHGKRNLARIPNAL